MDNSNSLESTSISSFTVAGGKITSNSSSNSTGISNRQAIVPLVPQNVSIRFLQTIFIPVIAIRIVFTLSTNARTFLSPSLNTSALICIVAVCFFENVIGSSTFSPTILYSLSFCSIKSCVPDSSSFTVISTSPVNNFND